MPEKIFQVEVKAQAHVWNSKGCDKKQSNSINLMLLDCKRERKNV